MKAIEWQTPYSTCREFIRKDGDAFMEVANDAQARSVALALNAAYNSGIMKHQYMIESDGMLTNEPRNPRNTTRDLEKQIEDPLYLASSLFNVVKDMDGIYSCLLDDLADLIRYLEEKKVRS